LTRVPTESLGLILLLVVAFIVRAVLLRRSALPKVAEQDTSSDSAEPDKHLATPAHPVRYYPDDALGGPTGSAPSGEHSEALVPPQPAVSARDALGVPADGTGTTLPSSTAPLPEGAARTPASPVAHLEQATTLPQAPKSSAVTGGVDPEPAASPAPAQSQRVQRRTDLAVVRAWARASGYTVADRGRVATVVLAAYDRVH